MLFSALENKNFCIFTGGPGSGKTTVLNLLSNIGYMTIKETGREIIQNQMKTNGSAVPWIDTKRYAHLMFLHSLIDFEEKKFSCFLSGTRYTLTIRKESKIRKKQKEPVML